MKMKKAVVLLLAGLTALFCAASLRAQDPPPQGGFPNPLLTVNRSGKVVLTYSRWADQVKKGSYTLVSFWASWSEECQTEASYVQAVYQEFKGKGLVVLGVPYGDEITDSMEAMTAWGITYPQLVDVADDLAGPFDLDSVPYIVLLGPDGKVVAGGLRGEEIRKAVAACF